MCGPDGKPVWGEDDPAVELNRLLLKYTNYPPDVRKMIREHWDTIKRLAHRIHDQETSELRRQQRRALAELDDFKKYG